MAGIAVVVGINAWLATKAYQAGRMAEQAAIASQINQETNMRATKLSAGALTIAAASMLAGCTTSRPAPVTADGLRAVVGTSLIGARRATPTDQARSTRPRQGCAAAASGRRANVLVTGATRGNSRAQGLEHWRTNPWKSNSHALTNGSNPLNAC